MPLREIIAYSLIALVVLACVWGLMAYRRHRKRERDIKRGKISPSHSSSRRR